MQSTATTGSAARPTSPGRTALAILLLTGAGVAAIARPLDRPPQPRNLSQPNIPSTVRAATIRIVLPPSAALAPVERSRSTGTLRIVLRHLGPDAPSAPVPAVAPSGAPESAALAVAAAKAPTPSMASPRIVAHVAIGQTTPADRLAAARGKDMATYSPTRYETADSRTPESMSMVGDDDWAALTRSYGAGQSAAASATDRAAALQPAKAPPRALSGPVPIPLDPAADIGQPQMVATHPAGQKRREIDAVSLSVATKLNGTAVGRVSLLINDDENISIRVADLLAILKRETEASLYARLSSAQNYMTFNELRAAGLAVRFDDRDRLILDTR